MLEFQCPHCKEVLAIPEQFIGSKGTCRKCKQSIFIEQQDMHDTSKEFNAYAGDKNPTLIVLHLESTGPSSRKCNIIEIAGIKIDIRGREIDTFWTFCNPDQPIPEKIQARTGISDDMVAQAPYPYEVIKEWFEWTGPHSLFLCDHPHFHAKFLCTPLLREDIEPPVARTVGIEDLAKNYKLPTAEYKLRPLLDSIGHPLKPGHHRALETCQGIRSLIQILQKKEEELIPMNSGGTVFGKLLHKTDNAKVEQQLYDKLLTQSNDLNAMCGADFHARDSYESRKNQPAKTNGTNGNPRKAMPSPVPYMMHMPEWYAEKKRLIESSYHNPDLFDEEKFRDTQNDAKWEYVLLEASQIHNIDEKRRYFLEAISLGAKDPWPYEQLTGFYIKSKDYKSAQRICERFFETDSWKFPKNAGTSLKLLDRLERLEKKLSHAN
jgi:DNA polymerase III epsilon subunit-like protein